MPTNLAHMLELSVVQTTESASMLEKAQRAAWPHLARGGGNLQSIEGELVGVSRHRSDQCAAGHLSETTGRMQPKTAGVASRPN